MLLDEGFGVGRQFGASFGANGTPMGVLIDARGRVASELVSGAQKVLSLARGDAFEVTGSPKG